VLSEKGLPRQRNAGLWHLNGDCDIVCFLDDDFLPARHALRRMREAFARWPEVSGMTGHLIRDGIHGPGLTAETALQLVEAWDAEHDADAPFAMLGRGLEGLYGCNMAVRTADIGDIRFDERLPLYGWQEDIDFAAQLPGDRIKTDAFSGVHMGIKSGRETAGKRLGYSQITNTWYLWRKGTMTARFAAKLAFRNLVANHLKIARPEPWIDRKGRAVGNRLALWEIVTGRARPERILTL
jgi:glycosyltransferase involved in cell wall biosynthesis